LANKKIGGEKDPFHAAKKKMEKIQFGLKIENFFRRKKIVWSGCKSTTVAAFVNNYAHNSGEAIDRYVPMLSVMFALISEFGGGVTRALIGSTKVKSFRKNYFLSPPPLSCFFFCFCVHSGKS
jgi:hypothetical protein